MLSMPGRLINLDNRKAKAYCACSRCGWGVLCIFFYHISFLPLPMGDGAIQT